jgi:hypothetical protein
LHFILALDVTLGTVYTSCKRKEGASSHYAVTSALS